MTRFAAVALLALALSACAPVPRSTPMPDGPPAAAPAGWTAYCAREPDAERCSGQLVVGRVGSGGPEGPTTAAQQRT